MIIDPDLRNEITRNLTVTLPEATIRDENLVNYMMHILNKIGSIEKQKKSFTCKILKGFAREKVRYEIIFSLSTDCPEC